MILPMASVKKKFNIDLAKMATLRFGMEPLLSQVVLQA